jgi:hypothetical protein
LGGRIQVTWGDPVKNRNRTKQKKHLRELSRSFHPVEVTLRKQLFRKRAFKDINLQTP